jgi:hypothetical protein
MEVDWEKFREFLELRSKNKKHINNLLNYAKKYNYLIFLNPLDFALEMKKLTEQKRSLKRHVLQALAALSKFLDLQSDKEIYYKRFRELREKAGIRWGEEKIPKILERSLDKDEILRKVKEIKNERLRAISILHLLTGLRTGELIFLIKNFERLNKVKINEGFIIELNYLRRTKKVYFTVLHEKCLEFFKKAYKNRKSYWNNIKKTGLKPYDFRRIFESLYPELRSHEIDLLQGRASSELTVHYTRDLESLAQKILKEQKRILENIVEN